MEQNRARIRGQLVEHVAGCVSEGRAETKNLLELLCRVESNNLPGTMSISLPPCQRGGILESPLLIGHPHCDLTGVGGTERSPSRHRLSNGTGGQSSRGQFKKLASGAFGGHFCLSATRVVFAN